MKALLLAAGRGKRLRPLTDMCPKPLLPVGKQRLWDWELAALKKAGVTEVVVNTAHLADQFEVMPEIYAAHGLTLTLSREGTTDADALESLGGIAKALPLLTDGKTPFLVAAGDVVHAFPMEELVQAGQAIEAGDYDALIVAVPNPSYHAEGDLSLKEDGTVVPGKGPYTYGCLMVVSPRIFAGVKPVFAKLFPWLWHNARVKGLVWNGFWANVGDPTELAKLCSDARAPKWLEGF